MSYRDLRNLAEMMRALNFPKHISLESFRQPNFPLVAEMLRWLVLRYDQNAAILDCVQKEADRILFIKSIVQFLALKAHLKLNIKRLYQADRHAVKELIKVASLLYDAINISKMSLLLTSAEFDEQPKKSDFSSSSKQTEIRRIRELSSLITEKGAVLYDLLEKEIELKRLREEAINKPPDIDGIGRDIHKAIKSIDEEIHKTVKLLDNVSTDEANLENKTANRQEELERLHKRLKSLGSVRPAFMDEYEAEEKKLEKLYEEYVLRFRNLTYLESQLEQFHQASQRDLDAFDNRVESAKKQSAVFTSSAALNGAQNGSFDGANGINDSDESSLDENDEEFEKRIDRPGGASGVKRRGGGASKSRGGSAATGSNGATTGGKMYGGGDDDDDDDDSDEDSDEEDDSADDGLDDEDDDDLGGRDLRGNDEGDEDDDDDFALGGAGGNEQSRSKGSRGGNKGGGRGRGKRNQLSGDEDDDDESGGRRGGGANDDDDDNF